MTAEPPSRNKLRSSDVLEPLTIEYRFTLPNDESIRIPLALDPKGLGLTNRLPEPLPPWVNLAHCQCPNCTLTVASTPVCPLAANLVRIVQYFDTLKSFHAIEVEVITKERIVRQNTTVQRGVSSLVGLIIATCGCPHTTFLRCMARHHLPLATEEETICRAMAMYMLAQYFHNKEGKKTDMELTGLKALYQNLHVVNATIAGRLRTACTSDSTINSIILLDIYAQALPLVIEEYLEEIQHVLEPLLQSNIVERIPTAIGAFGVPESTPAA